MRDVVDEVGADAARFFFLSRSADSQMEFDLELAKRQSAENPVYYVQYAHARIAGILTKAGERIASFDDADVSLLVAPDGAGARTEDAGAAGAGAADGAGDGAASPAALCGRLATAFHAFYTDCRVIDEEDVPLSKARLKLCLAAKIALARALTLMGMSTPERM